MGMIAASNLDSRVQFQRASTTPDPFGGSTETWGDHGGLIWCLREDVKDSESVQAGAFRSRLMTRFHVRSTAFTRDLTTSDRVVSDGTTFEIVGIKRAAQGRRQLIEITGESIVD